MRSRAATLAQLLSSPPTSSTSLLPGSSTGMPASRPDSWPSADSAPASSPFSSVAIAYKRGRIRRGAWGVPVRGRGCEVWGTARVGECR